MLYKIPGTGIIPEEMIMNSNRTNNLSQIYPPSKSIKWKMYLPGWSYKLSWLAQITKEHWFSACRSMTRATFSIIVLWLIAVSVSLYWNLAEEKKKHTETALLTARAFFRQIVMQRSWNTRHGGVYVPISETVQPNPYLQTAYREVTTVDGLNLTLINPAYMTRQLAELAAKEEGIQYHITSLKPIRPENQATDWENEWLKSFESGAPEQYSLIENISGEKFRYMAPLYIEEGCLNCHASQGYKKGDVRGGISITMPLPALDAIHPVWVSHGIATLMGILGIMFSCFLLGQRERKLMRTNEQMEQEITERTVVEKELRQAERQWNQTFNCIADFVSVHDLEHRFLRVNKPLAEYLGLTPEEIVGKRCFEVMHNINEPWCDCPHSKTLDTKLTVTARVNDPHIGVPLSITTSPLLDDNNELIGTVHIARDISAEEKAHEREKKLQGQLIQAQKMEAVGTLAGGIAHDFNNLLTPILGCAEILKIELPEGGREEDLIDKMLQAVDRTRNLVKQLLVFSRKTEKDFKPLYIQIIIKEALKLLRSALPATIEIRQDVLSDCGMVLADETQIHQIIMNLCTNAYQAMGAEGGTLAISLKPVDIEKSDTKALNLDMVPGPYLRLEVSDTGYGMEKSDIERIFEPYFTTKQEKGGTGLGLAIIRSVDQRFILTNLT